MRYSLPAKPCQSRGSTWNGGPSGVKGAVEIQQVGSGEDQSRSPGTWILSIGTPLYSHS